VRCGADPGLPVLDLPDVVVPERNAYDFRLVVSRVLYDKAVGTRQSPSIAHLARAAAVHVHPLDLERVGTTDGRDVRVATTRTSIVLRAVADPTVIRGTAWVPFNLPGPNVGELIDCFAAVNDVRIETL
jgi:NADH-quinone oxidoreductase subunit G